MPCLGRSLARGLLELVMLKGDYRECETLGCSRPGEGGELMSLGVQSLQRGQIGKGDLQPVSWMIFQANFRGSFPKKTRGIFFLLVPALTCNSMLPSGPQALLHLTLS